MEEEKRSKLKRILKIIIAGLLLAILIITIYAYRNPEFSTFVTKIKNMVMSEYCSSISIVKVENANNSNFVQYGSGLIRIKSGEFEYYSVGKQQWKVENNIDKPLINTSSKYILVGEENGSTLCLYKKNELVWTKEIDGSLQSLFVNNEGYVGIIYTNKTFKQIVKIFDNEGEELLVRYYPNNYAVAIRISEDNKYFAVAEINLTSASANTVSGIRLISIDHDDISHFEQDSIIADIRFVDKNNLLILYDKKVAKYNIKDAKYEIIRTWKPSDVADMLISDDGIITEIRKLSNAFINETQSGNIEFFDMNNATTGAYNYTSKVLDTTFLNQILAINSNLEVYFINTTGKRIGMFKTDKPIKNIVLFNNGHLAAIIYANEIEFIKVY